MATPETDPASLYRSRRLGTRSPRGQARQTRLYSPTRPLPSAWLSSEGLRSPAPALQMPRRWDARQVVREVRRRASPLAPGRDATQAESARRAPGQCAVQSAALVQQLAPAEGSLPGDRSRAARTSSRAGATAPPAWRATRPRARAVPSLTRRHVRTERAQDRQRNGGTRASVAKARHRSLSWGSSSVGARSVKASSDSREQVYALARPARLFDRYVPEQALKPRRLSARMYSRTENRQVD
jgi:hypothetical protein